jgi:hypothetical protein
VRCVCACALCVVLVKRYHSEKDYYYHNEHSFEQKLRDQAMATASSASASASASAPASASASASAVSVVAVDEKKALSFAAGSKEPQRTSTFTPITPVGGTTEAKSWKRLLRPSDEKEGPASASAGGSASAPASGALSALSKHSDERWKAKVPNGFVAAARFLRSDAPSAVMQNPQFDIKSQWLRRYAAVLCCCCAVLCCAVPCLMCGLSRGCRCALCSLSTLNTPVAEKDMDSLTNDEVLLADHCVNSLLNRVTAQLFQAADERDDE